jgi:hypothetical protein
VLRRPAELPKWATHSYGSDEIAWDEALRQCRDILYGWAAAGEPHPYTELSDLVTAIPWPQGPHTHEGQQIGYLLGQVSVAELDVDDDRPLLSAMVYGKETNGPTGGFWTLLDELGVKVPASGTARTDYWLREVAECKQVYGPKGRQQSASPPH